jgi:D-glycero-D-manno-heptose 1,7-bisphosphate phosphatase
MPFNVPTDDDLRPAVFLDRDGTLNRDPGYLHRPENFTWVPGAPQAVRRLNEAGLLVVVVTNQSGVARGYYDEDAVHHLHEFMQEHLREHGARVDAFYFSPYHPEGTVAPYDRQSACRKPGTELFERAIREHGIDPARSFVVGDKNSDVAPGNALGMTTFLVETGESDEHLADTPADHVAADVGAAAERITAMLASGAAR